MPPKKRRNKRIGVQHRNEVLQTPALENPVTDTKLTGKRKMKDRDDDLEVHFSQNQGETKKKRTEEGKKTTLSMVTWNMEKFGKTTMKSLQREKRNAIYRILDKHHPMIMVMQEVSDAKVLFEGRGRVKGLNDFTNADISGVKPQRPRRTWNEHDMLKAKLTFLEQLDLMPSTLPELLDALEALNESVFYEEAPDNEKLEKEKILRFNYAFSESREELNMLILWAKKLNRSKINQNKELFKQRFSQLIADYKQLVEKLKEQIPIDKKYDSYKKKYLWIGNEDEILEKEAEKTDNLLEEELKAEMFSETPEDPMELSDRIKKVSKLTESEFIKAIQETTVIGDYEILKGPKFGAGKEMQNTPDYYPLIYDKSAIIQKPELWTYDYHYETFQKIKDGKLVARYGTFEFDAEEETEMIMSEEGDQVFTDTFRDKKVQINRRLVLWKFNIPAHRYFLRTTNIRKTDYFEWIELFVGVIHTSPSIDVGKEVKKAMEAGKKISEASGIPILIGGDWYMERELPKEWGELKEGRSEEKWSWELIAPDTITNFPTKGRGQTADHFMGGPGISGNYTRAIGKRFLETNANSFGPQHSAFLREWTDISVDHAPIYTLVDIDLEKHYDALKSREFKTEIDMKKKEGSYKENFMLDETAIEIRLEYTTQYQYGEKNDSGKRVCLISGSEEYIINDQPINCLAPNNPVKSVLAIDTQKMNSEQLVSVLPRQNIAQVRFRMETGQVDIACENGQNPPIRLNEKGDSTSACVFVEGIMQGCVLILGNYTDKKSDWDAKIVKIRDNASLEAIDWHTLLDFQCDEPSITSEGLKKINVVIAVNLLKPDALKEHDMELADILIENLIDKCGLTGNQITLYHTYTRGNNYMSIGVNSFGEWGEII